MVGEVLVQDSVQTAFFQGGKTGWDGIDTKLPTVFDFKLWQTSGEVFTGREPASALRDVLKYDGLYGDINKVTVPTGNHDIDRFMSLPGATVEGAMMHMAFVLSTRGIPQIYYGDEIAMPGGFDPDNRRDFPGGFPVRPHNAFAEEGRTDDQRRQIEETRSWIEIRRAFKSLRLGRTVDLIYDQDLYVFARLHEDEHFVVAVNLGKQPTTVTFDAPSIGFSEKRIGCHPKGGRNTQQVSIFGGTDGTISLLLPGMTVIGYDCKVLQPANKGRV
jgi:glycosidase